MSEHTKPQPQPQVRKRLVARVIIDPSDATQDRFIPLTEARMLYTAGRLSFDPVTSAYCRIVEDERASRIPEFLLEESNV